MDLTYNNITFDMLGTKRQRPMYLSNFTKLRAAMSMSTYPKDPHLYTKEFLAHIDAWIHAHQQVRYTGLDTFTHRDAILGTTQQLDELHLLYGPKIATMRGEYKYHRRLTDFTVKQIEHFTELVPGDVMVASYPSCITTGYVDDFDLLLDHCEHRRIPVHIDGAWFGQCRNFELDVTHPAIASVSISLSKAFGMGSQRIGIRYARERVPGPISIMNDFDYCNVSDMWIGIEMMQQFGPDYWWRNYSELYSKVCNDFGLNEGNSIHVGVLTNSDGNIVQYGIRTPLRFLIEGVYDVRGTDAGLNHIEKTERM